MRWAIPAYLAIQLLESNVITPMLIREELQLPSGGVLLFQLVGVALFGALGLLLAVPLLLVLVVLVREIYSYDILGLRSEKIEIAVDAQAACICAKVDCEKPAGATGTPTRPSHQKDHSEAAFLAGSSQGTSMDRSGAMPREQGRVRNWRKAGLCEAWRSRLTRKFRTAQRSP
jgi:hypothetical protein